MLVAILISVGVLKVDVLLRSNAVVFSVPMPNFSNSSKVSRAAIKIIHFHLFLCMKYLEKSRRNFDNILENSTKYVEIYNVLLILVKFKDHFTLSYMHFFSHLKCLFVNHLLGEKHFLKNL